jgi:hypothetical protein
MSLQPGQPAPWFIAPTASNPAFTFDSAAGRYVIVLLMPSDATVRGDAMRTLAANQGRLDDRFACAFVVVPPNIPVEGARDLRGLRWVFDQTGAITAHYGPDPRWLLLDPTLRVMATAPAADADAFFRTIAALPPPAGHAGVPLHAPVLLAPRIFEPELCRALVARHEVEGGAFTGVMRDVGDRTVAVMDELKTRRDIWIADPDLKTALRERLERRLFPLIELSLGFKATHIERYLVSCYDADDGGVFRPHRDNTTQGTAHRRFACSINLNDDFEGGDLRFAEYGPRTYRPHVGGAVVFSCALMHEAMPVTRGRRYAFLPFLFDESGAEVRAAYEARVQASQAAGA